MSVCSIAELQAKSTSLEVFSLLASRRADTIFEGLLISGSKRGMIALPDVGAALPEEARVRDRLRKLN